MNTRAQEIVERTQNPFAAPNTQESKTAAGAMISNQAMAAVQGAVMMAKQFPRDQAQAMQRILDSCTRVSLAQEALYEFPRGGTSVTGPSIRLAEVLAQQWGNIDFGIVELTQEGGRSQVMAYAWDLETNVRQQKIFVAEHVRHTKKGTKFLTDPRDIYEMTANQGARRMRACILGILPKDVIESAVDQVYLTLRNSMDAPAEEISKLVEAFAKFGVSAAAIKKRLGKNLDKVSAAEVIRFRQIYRSIVDGMSKPEQWFELDAEDQPGAAKAEAAKDLKDRLRKEDNPIVPEPKPGDLPVSEALADSNGEVFNTELHATNQAGEIIYNKDGSFRKKPAKKAADPEPPVIDEPPTVDENGQLI